MPPSDPFALRDNLPILSTLYLDFFDTITVFQEYVVTHLFSLPLFNNKGRFHIYFNSSKVCSMEFTKLISTIK